MLCLSPHHPGEGWCDRAVGQLFSISPYLLPFRPYLWAMAEQTSYNYSLWSWGALNLGAMTVRQRGHGHCRQSCCGCPGTHRLRGSPKVRAHLTSLHTGNLIPLVVEIWAFLLGTLRTRILPGSNKKIPCNISKTEAETVPGENSSGQDPNKYFEQIPWGKALRSSNSLQMPER